MTGRGLPTLGSHPSRVRTEGGTCGHVTWMCLLDSQVGTSGEQRFVRSSVGTAGGGVGEHCPWRGGACAGAG